MTKTTGEPIDSETTQPKKLNLLGELSGSIGDLGTFLPHVLGVISVAKLNPSSIFTGFGLFYIFCGWFYGMPMAVQPMKVASAVVMVEKLTAAEVAASGIMIGLILLLLGMTGLIDKLAKITPKGVIGGIQIGLGLSLAILGAKMFTADPLIGWLILILMLPILSSRRFPAAIMAILVGTALNFILHPGLTLPQLSFGVHLPEVILPGFEDFKRGLLLVALPQLPLTLTNAVLVTTALSHELFGKKAARVNDRNLCLTMGGANLLLAPFGGFMMCHGSGGMAAHHRFGGRTKYTPYIIGLVLLALGLLLGSDGAKLLALIPDAALGCLLFFSGVDLALAARGVEGREEFFLTLAVAALALALNPAIAFIAGLVLGKGMEKNWFQV
jgi:SulP family sulfate permease